MSDNLRRYRAIRNALMQAYPAQPTGNLARHLHTLAALISGIVGSKSTQLPHIAAKVPTGTKPESRVKRFARWFDNDHILEPASHGRHHEQYSPFQSAMCKRWDTPVILPSRPWCSSWMAVWRGAGAMP